MHVGMAVFMLLSQNAFPQLKSNYGERVHLFLIPDKSGPSLSLFTKVMAQRNVLFCIYYYLIIVNNNHK